MMTHSADETRRLAADLALRLKGGELIFLLGDLGAGKTTFAQGLAAALGATVRAKSPTFTVMHEYPCAGGPVRRLVHLDLYRFEDAAELRALALEDERRPDTVMVIEWPDKLPQIPWHADIEVRFTLGATESEREVTVVTNQ